MFAFSQVVGLRGCGAETQPRLACIFQQDWSGRPLGGSHHSCHVHGEDVIHIDVAQESSMVLTYSVIDSRLDMITPSALMLWACSMSCMVEVVQFQLEYRGGRGRRK